MSEIVSKPILNSYTTLYISLLSSNFLDASKSKKPQKYQCFEQSERTKNFRSWSFGGDGGIRTLDLTDANRTLSRACHILSKNGETVVIKKIKMKGKDGDLFPLSDSVLFQGILTVFPLSCRITAARKGRALPTIR